MGKYDNLATLADFAKKAGVTSGAVGTWLEEYNKSSDNPVLPAIIAGNTRLFEVIDLERLEAEKGRVGQKIRERGYVHPDTHKALESRYWESVRVSAETQTALNVALAELEALKSVSSEGGATWEGLYNGLLSEFDAMKAELIAANERIVEQNAVIVRASVENGDFVKEIDELKAVLAKAKEENDALILDNLSKANRIKGLVNDVESLKEVSSDDPDEKLFDAYAENQKLRETIDIMSGEITAMRSAIASV